MMKVPAMMVRGESCFDVFGIGAPIFSDKANPATVRQMMKAIKFKFL